MRNNDLDRHGAEFRRHLANKHFENTPSGVLFPKAGALAQGIYFHDVNGQDEQSDPNLLPDAGLVHMLDVALNNGTKIGTWYVSLYAAAYTPLAGLTAASYPGTASEITSATEGYTEANRQTWVPTAPTTPLIDNLASKAAFTIATASSLAVNGAALVSEATKGATTGTLISATKFASTRTLLDTDTFNVAYRIQLTPV